MALTEEQKRRREVMGVSVPKPVAAPEKPIPANSAGGFWPGDARVTVEAPVIPIASPAAQEAALGIAAPNHAPGLSLPEVTRTGAGGGFLPVLPIPENMRGVAPLPSPTARGGALYFDKDNPSYSGGGQLSAQNAADIAMKSKKMGAVRINGVTYDDASAAYDALRGPAIDLRPGTRGYFDQTGLQPSMGQQIPGAAGPAFMMDRNGSMVTDYPSSVRALPIGGNGGGSPSIRDQTRAILMDKGPVNRSALQSILAGVQGSVSGFGSGASEVMSYDPQREARMNAEPQRNTTGVSRGRWARIQAGREEAANREAGLDRRRAEGSADSLKQSLILEALKLDAAGQSVESERMWQQALNQEKRDFESQSQDKDIASREKVAGLNVGQRADAATATADAKASAAEDKKTATFERLLAQREKEYTSAETKFYSDPMNMDKAFEDSPQGKRLSKMIQENLRRITGEDPLGAGVDVADPVSQIPLNKVKWRQ